MKHLVLTRSGPRSESVTLHDDRDPLPGPGDVLVRMEAAAVNPSDRCCAFEHAAATRRGGNVLFAFEERH